MCVLSHLIMVGSAHLEMLQQVVYRCSASTVMHGNIRGMNWVAALPCTISVTSANKRAIVLNASEHVSRLCLVDFYICLLCLHVAKLSKA